ncbi:hypothetical protein E5206_04210 [Arthrobacter sp. PAMC25564]|nr:hypothetical protein E5206_04210 [Arthrobacter sp. PAMC25564]
MPGPRRRRGPAQPPARAPPGHPLIRPHRAAAVGEASLAVPGPGLPEDHVHRRTPAGSSPGETHGPCWLQECGADFIAGIRTGALDPFHGYANAIRDELPEAITVLDAFHIVKFGSAMVRRRVQSDELDGIRRTLRTWKTATLASFDNNGASNGPQSIDGVVETARSIPRGLRNFTNYRLRCLLAAGGLSGQTGGRASMLAGRGLTPGEGRQGSPCVVYQEAVDDLGFDGFVDGKQEYRGRDFQRDGPRDSALLSGEGENAEENLVKGKGQREEDDKQAHTDACVDAGSGCKVTEGEDRGVEDEQHEGEQADRELPFSPRGRAAFGCLIAVRDLPCPRGGDTTSEMAGDVRTAISPNHAYPLEGPLNATARWPGRSGAGVGWLYQVVPSALDALHRGGLLRWRRTRFLVLRPTVVWAGWGPFWPGLAGFLGCNGGDTRVGLRWRPSGCIVF